MAHAADNARHGAIDLTPAPLYRLPELAAKRFPDRQALNFFGKTTDYAQFCADIRRYAGALRHLGAKKGDRIIIAMPNCPQAAAFYYAILRIGAIVVNMNPASASPEATHVIADSGAAFAVTVNIKRITDMLERACMLADNACRVKKILVADFTDALPFFKKHAFRIFKSGEMTRPYACQGRFFAMAHLPKNIPPAPAAAIDPKRDVAALQYTGGTTGRAKGAMLTHSNLYANALQSASRIDFLQDGQETIAAVLPFFHVFAMTAVLNVGISKGFCLRLYPLPDLKALCRDIHAKRVTVLPGVPALFIKMARMYAEKNYNFSGLKCAVSGGAPLAPSDKEEFESLTGSYIIEGYGLTEASPVITLHPYRPPGGDRPGSAGLPLPGTLVRICQFYEDGERAAILRTGETGEICVRGPQVMRGYHRLPEGERMPIDAEGWLRTGDLGYTDQDGYVYIVGRAKEMIIVSGFNVYPREIEDLLCRRDDILEAAAIAAPCPRTGQAVKLFIAARPGKTPPESDIYRYLEEHLSRYKLPRRIVFMEELPKTLVGKVDKKKLDTSLQ